MNVEPKQLLKSAMQKCLPELENLVATCKSPQMVWTKEEEGCWRGGYADRLDFVAFFGAARETIEAHGKPFAESFFKHHPDHIVVGFPWSFRDNLKSDITYIFRSAILHLWRQHEKFDVGERAVDSLVNEFEMFVDEPTVRLQFRSELLNFKTQEHSIDLPKGLKVRRMTVPEISECYGGSIENRRMTRPTLFGIHEFCIEGEIEEKKAFGDLEDDGQPLKDRVKPLLDKAMLCLRTFKAGHVGYDFVHFYPRTFCPLSLPSCLCGDFYVPFGNYTLGVEEHYQLEEHAKTVFDNNEASMEMACLRLADAENRVKPQDRLVDAIIGMESLLLAGLKNDDRRGELRFRFSLHYSTLFKTPEERLRAFRLAKHLYDLRSAVAHGSTLRDSYSVGGKKLDLPKAASLASETLRFLVRHFLPNSKHAPYRKHEFWERAYFGLSDEQGTPNRSLGQPT